MLCVLSRVLGSSDVDVRNNYAGQESNTNAQRILSLYHQKKCIPVSLYVQKTWVIEEDAYSSLRKTFYSYRIDYEKDRTEKVENLTVPPSGAKGLNRRGGEGTGPFSQDV